MGRVLALLIVLALAGCTVPPSAGVTFPSYSPVREALSYFPATAPVVAVVHTDSQEPGLRRLAGLGALAPLRRAAAARGVYLRQWRGILGNPAVVGQARVGGPPLAVLPAADADSLRELVVARVAAGRAQAAGRYRGADLYAERGLAFAVRDRVLLLSASTRDLLAALDTRVGNASFEAYQLTAMLPREAPQATFARGYVDLAAFVVRADAGIRSVPVLRALGASGFSVGATAEELRAVMSADTSAAGMTSNDLPGLDRPSGRQPVPAGGFSLSVADLAPVAAAAERALRAARPVTALKVDALRSRLRAAGVELTPALLSGPAVVTLRPALALHPARLAPVRAALDRVARHFDLRRRRGLYVLDGVRIGLVRQVFVAGRAPAAVLRSLARVPLTTADGPLSLSIPAGHGFLNHPLVVSLSGSADRVTARAISGF